VGEYMLLVVSNCDIRDFKKGNAYFLDLGVKIDYPSDLVVVMLSYIVEHYSGSMWVDSIA